MIEYSTSMIKLPSGELRIGGKKIKTGSRMPSINPATDEVIGEFYVASEEDVKLAVETARQAQKTWGAMPLDYRISYIKKFRNLVVDKTDEITKVCATENGIPICSAMALNIAPAPTFAKMYEVTAGKILSDEKIKTPGHFRMFSNIRTTYKIYDPLGVIGIIVPWNAPFFLTTLSLIPALIAGNSAVVKPSEFATFSVLKLYELFEEIGLPAGVLNIVNGADETGKYLCRSKVDKIAFTGGDKTGEKIIAQCADDLTRVCLELGGIDAMLVLADADIDEAVNAALVGSLIQTGQLCFGSKRIFVAREIKAKFQEKLLRRIKKLKIGDPLDPNTDIGTLIEKEQIKNTDAFVQDAVKNGATLLCGGKAVEEGKAYYQPTVLTDLDLKMKLSFRERFAPVIGIYEFEDEDQAVAMANYPEFGLTGQIWSQNLKHAQKIARRLTAGTIYINIMGLPRWASFGGTKRSGFGREGAKEGLRLMTNEKVIDVLEYRQRFRPRWFPYSRHTCDFIINTTKFVFEDGIKDKMNLLIKVVKGYFAKLKEYREFTRN